MLTNIVFSRKPIQMSRNYSYNNVSLIDIQVYFYHLQNELKEESIFQKILKLNRYSKARGDLVPKK